MQEWIDESLSSHGAKSVRRPATDPGETTARPSTLVKLPHPEKNDPEDQSEDYWYSPSDELIISELHLEEVPRGLGVEEELDENGVIPLDGIQEGEELDICQEPDLRKMQPCTAEMIGSEPTEILQYVWRLFGEELPPENAPQLDDPRWQSFRTVVVGQEGMYRVDGDYNSNAQGTYADVSKRDAWFEGRVRVQVAVKRLRLLNVTDPSRPKATDMAERCRKRLNKETMIWMALNHPNIAPLLGFNDDKAFCMISPWFENGNIDEYLRRTEPQPRERLHLVLQVASGVEYLHNLLPAIVHGDLKPDNIVVDKHGIARIIDFGLSKAIEDVTGPGTQSSSSRQGAGNVRWLAQELVTGVAQARSPSSDVYSFASVAFFIMTGELPFAHHSTEYKICIARSKGEQPIRPGTPYPVFDGIANYANGGG
ncbi:hypothetical protein FRC00_007293 [Tulasnella sp. 408]|nr:hypothetical protein FRC00_007293 [Tulasnella sp. 408]